MDLNGLLSETRFVVIDTETTGVDENTARVLSIGACTVEGNRLPLDLSIELFVRQDVPSDAHNILVHGIGHDQQTRGIDPEGAWLRFIEFAGQAQLVAYHAAFDAAVVGRELRRLLGVAYKAPWLDVGVLLCAMFPNLDAAHWELERWLEHAGIENFARHSALGDAFATAELLLYTLAHAQRRGVQRLHALHALHRQHALRDSQTMLPGA